MYGSNALCTNKPKLSAICSKRLAQIPIEIINEILETLDNFLKCV